MKKNKNILQLVEHLLPGGTERMAVNISNLLVKNGHQVVLCTTRAKGALEQEILPAVQLECLYKSHFLDIRAFLKFCTVVRKHKIDIIHAHSTSIYWAALLKVFFPRVSLIWHDHFGFSENLKDSDRPLIRHLSFLFFGIISVNEKLRLWSVKNCKVSSDKILLLKNFPQLSLSIKKAERTSLKIVLLANLRPQKDHVTFVEALIYLKAHVIEKDIKVVFAGLYWDDPYFHSIKNVLESHDLIDRVDFVGSVNDVMSLLMDCDIGVLSSTSEGLPVSLLEYGQAGLPVIVTDVGQCAEVVDYGKAGLVVPPADSKAFSEALLDLIQHPEKRVHLGSTLQQRIEKEYGAQKFFEEYSKLIG